MKQIIEIMPDDMPDWMQEAIDRGELARVCMDRIEALELKLSDKVTGDCCRRLDTLEAQIERAEKDRIAIAIIRDGKTSVARRRIATLEAQLEAVRKEVRENPSGASRELHDLLAAINQD